MLVELASLSDPDLVPATIARSLGLDPGRDAQATLIDALAERELLLVLDNLEHLTAAAPGLVSLIAKAPRLVVLVTTQVVLHVSGEHVHPVAPLARTTPSSSSANVPAPGSVVRAGHGDAAHGRLDRPAPGQPAAVDRARRGSRPDPGPA